MLPETRIIRRIQQHVADSPNSFCVKTHTSGATKKQLDLVGSYYGVPFWVDAKRRGGKASKLQLGLVRIARNGGYVSGIVDSVEAFEGLFK